MPKRSAPTASIVILCHNDGAYLKECVQSLFEHTDVSYEIILVNNATKDGSEKYLNQLARRANIRVIHNAENRFFAGGNNQGILAAKGRYVVLLNADAVVGPQWLSRMIRCVEREPRIGLAAPCTNGATGIQLVQNPGYASMKDFPRFARDWAGHYDGWWKEAHRLIGFCLLIKRETLEKVGLLDERFGRGGYEDYDYCLRVQQAGYKLALAQDVFVHHYGGKGYVGVDYDYHRGINREILARKWSQFVFHSLDDLDKIELRNTGTQTGVMSGALPRRLAARG